MKKEQRIEKELEDFTKEQLISTIKNAIDKNDSFKQEILGLVNKNKDNFKKTNEDEKNYSEYNTSWNEAEEIISKFNEYGGGDEDDEEIVYNNLDKIVQLFQQEKLDEKTKIEFINNCFECYFWGNSGFEDLLRDSVFEVCNSKENWLFVIEKLKKSNSSYDKKRIMRIYKENLHDDNTYLNLRMSKLYYGMDYFDLVNYYNKKGDIEKSVEISKEGIEKGEGRIIDLIEFLLEFYIKNKDYENTLKYYILSFKDDSSLEKYQEIKKFCKKEDFIEVSKTLYEAINDGRNREVKAEIDFFNGNYQLVFDYVKDCEASFFYNGTLKEWAQKLEPYFPNEIIKIYKNKSIQIINSKNAKNYPNVAFYLNGIQHISIDILHDKNEWNNFLALLKQKSIKLPAFQRELQKFGDK